MARKRTSGKRTVKYFICITATVAFLLMIYVAFLVTKRTIDEVTLNLSGPYAVEKVIDGDTIIVSLDSQDVHVRLIGIDTPESVADATYKENTKEGEEAAQYTTNLLEGSSVYLEYDQELTDDYGRTLCYVYLHDGTTMVNELLLLNGYARTMPISPNTKYEERFDMAEHQAKELKAGFWGTGFY